MGDRLPPRWRSARLGVPAPAAVMALVVAAALAAVVVGVLLLGRPAPVAQPVPSRAVVPAPTPLVDDPAATLTSTSAQTASATTMALAAPPLVVHVVGAVGAPGVVELPAGSRVADAVEAAGGVTSEADLARVNLARALVDGEQVHVPRPGEELSEAAVPVSRGPTASEPAGSGEGSVLDLNAAGVTELEALPGIGPVLAERVIAWRDEHGRFSTVDELGEVSGIGERLLEQLRPLVRV